MSNHHQAHSEQFDLDAAIAAAVRERDIAAEARRAAEQVEQHARQRQQISEFAACVEPHIPPELRAALGWGYNTYPSNDYGAADERRSGQLAWDYVPVATLRDPQAPALELQLREAYGGWAVINPTNFTWLERVLAECPRVEELAITILLALHTNRVNQPANQPAS